MSTLIQWEILTEKGSSFINFLKFSVKKQSLLGKKSKESFFSTGKTLRNHKNQMQ